MAKSLVLPTARSWSTESVDYYIAEDTAIGFVSLSLTLELNNPRSLLAIMKASLLSSMLDRGTKSRSKFQIAAELEELGAELSISVNTRVLRIGARCLKHDLSTLIELLTDLLKNSTYPPDEFEQIKGIVSTSLNRSLNSTGRRSAEALSQLIYPLSHPNYLWKTEDKIEQLDSIMLDDIKETESTSLFGSRLLAVASGDFELEEFEGLVKEVAAYLVDRPSEAIEYPRVAMSKPGRQEVHLDGKPNIDVLLGHSLQLRREDDDYYPLMLGVFALGGNFGSRLMRQVRDEHGLTYGINSSIAGIHDLWDGAWRISVTLSPDKLEQGIELTKKVCTDLIVNGLTQEELDQKKSTVIGSYNVGMSSAASLAGVLRRAGERSKGIDWIRSFESRISSVGLDEVNGVLKKHLSVDNLNIAMAGGLT